MLTLLPTPPRDRQRAQTNLGSLIHQFVRSYALGVVYFSPRDVVLSEANVVQPDLMHISNDRIHIDTEVQESDSEGRPTLYEVTRANQRKPFCH